MSRYRTSVTSTGDSVNESSARSVAVRLAVVRLTVIAHSDMHRHVNGISLCFTLY